MFKRILKTLGALTAGHGIQTITQLLLPPAFIAAYGLKGYGEWLVLSAAVGYLSTLDFGLQTYVLNELTALYHRNEMDEFHRVQSVGLRLMLMFVGAGVVLAACVFLLPIATVLKVSASPTTVHWTVFCLALQVLMSIPLGQILGVYRTFGQAHRGVMWGNLCRILLLAITTGLAFLRAPFYQIALAQFLTISIFSVMVTFVLYCSNREVCPRLDYWDSTLARHILKPSAFFGLFVLNNFLVYQAPILMLQRFLGSEVVVGFSVARTLFSFVRQGAALVQQGLAPEVTRLSGVGDKERLVRLYVLFEGVLLATILILNAGVLIASPVLLRFWLKRPELFNLSLFVPVMLISIVSSIKEYKIYFQYATNRHARTGFGTFASYLVMILLSFPAMLWFGVAGFLTIWLVVEVLQLGLVHSYNAQLLDGHHSISLQPAFRLGLALFAMLVLPCSARSFMQSQHYLLQGVAAISAMAILAGVSYFLFNLRDVIRESKDQLLRLRLGRI